MKAKTKRKVTPLAIKMSKADLKEYDVKAEAFFSSDEFRGIDTIEIQLADGKTVMEFL